MRRSASLEARSLETETVHEGVVSLCVLEQVPSVKIRSLSPPDNWELLTDL